MTCSALLIVWPFVSVSVYCVYVVTPQPQQPTAPFTFIRLILILMRRLEAGVPRRGANEWSARACWCVRVCVRVTDAGGQNCNQISAAPSSPPSSTTSGAASVHTNANMLRYTPACGSAQAAQTCEVCVCETVCTSVCVCVLTNGRGLA